MIIAGVHIVLGTEPCVVTGGFRECGDVRGNREDEFVWEFENCKDGMRRGWCMVRGLVKARTVAGLRFRRSQGL